jgi:hypothetical protein
MAIKDLTDREILQLLEEISVQLQDRSGTTPYESQATWSSRLAWDLKGVIRPRKQDLDRIEKESVWPGVET